MNFLIKTLLVLLIFTLALPASAKKWRVNNALSLEEVDFQELKDAVESTDVLSGDTIYVEGSSVPYEGGIEVYKQLAIIGPGYLLSQANVQPTVCDFLPATIGEASSSVDVDGIFLRVGSDNTFITGLEFATNFSFPVSIGIENTSNITITRNRIEWIRFENGASGQVNNCSNIFITRNLILKEISFGCPILVNTILIGNNLIVGRIDHECSFTDETNIVNGVVEYNTLKENTVSSIWIKGSIIRNNFAGEIEALITENSAIQNNRLGANNSINMAIVAIDDSNIISPFESSDWDFETDNWELQPLDNIHGAYNGANAIYSNHPVSAANLPAFPTIYKCFVQPCGDTTIQVQFSIRSNQ